MTIAPIRDRAPDGEGVTDYDREHAATYLRLLDAESAGADWEEACQIVLGFDASADPERAKAAYQSHLSRAQWLRDGGFKTLL